MGLLIFLGMLAIGAVIYFDQDNKNVTTSILKYPGGKDFFKTDEIGYFFVRSNNFVSDVELFLAQVISTAPCRPQYWWKHQTTTYLNARGHQLSFSEEEGCILLNFTHRFQLDSNTYLVILSDGRMLFWVIDQTYMRTEFYLLNPDNYPRGDINLPPTTIDLSGGDEKLRPVFSGMLVSGGAIETGLTLKDRALAQPMHVSIFLAASQANNLPVYTAHLLSLNFNTGILTSAPLPWLNTSKPFIENDGSLEVVAPIPGFDDLLIAGNNLPLIRLKRNGTFVHYFGPDDLKDVKEKT